MTGHPDSKSMMGGFLPCRWVTLYNLIKYVSENHLFDFDRALLVLGGERQLLPRAALVLDQRCRAAADDDAAPIGKGDVRVGTLIGMSFIRSEIMLWELGSYLNLILKLRKNLRTRSRD